MATEGEAGRVQKRARLAGANSLAGATAAADRERAAAEGELSALERMHPDVLAEVLQHLGPVAAAPVRLVSKRMRRAVDSVRWRSLRLTACTTSKIEQAAASIFRQQSVRAALRTHRFVELLSAKLPSFSTSTSTSGNGWLKLESCASLDLHLTQSCWKKGERSEWFGAVASLLWACSASSGGLGGISLTLEDYGVGDMYSMRRKNVNCIISLILDLLCAPEASGGSCNTLKTVSFKKKGKDYHDHPPHEFLQPLPRTRFPHLEAAQLLCVLDAAATSAMSGTLPSLRSAVMRLRDGAALAALSQHPALAELEISVHYKMHLGYGYPPPYECTRGFEDFAAGRAAHRLQKLIMSFGTRAGFQVSEIHALGQLTSLERLELTIDLSTREAIRDAPAAGVYEQAFGSLQKLRQLVLDFNITGPFFLKSRSTSPGPLPWPTCTLGMLHLRSFARVFNDLCARSLTRISLIMRADPDLQTCTAKGARLEDLDMEKEAALAELLRAAGPALIELGVSSTVAFASGAAFAALASCSGLRKLDLIGYSGHEQPVSVSAAVDVLASCSELRSLHGLQIPFTNEQEATDALVAPLQRLADACKLGDFSDCSFILRPGKRVQGDDRARLLKLANECICSSLLHGQTSVYRPNILVTRSTTVSTPITYRDFEYQYKQRLDRKSSRSGPSNDF